LTRSTASSRDLTIGQTRALWAWAFLALPVVFFVAIRFYPAADALLASFTNWNIVGKREWIGVANYTRLAHDAVFWKVIGNTFLYLALGVPISLLLSFVVAYYLDRVRFGHGSCARSISFPISRRRWRWRGSGAGSTRPARRRVQRVAHELGLLADAFPPLDDAGVAGRARARDLGGASASRS
jgi:signal transduction histidine kinase